MSNRKSKKSHCTKLSDTSISTSTNSISADKNIVKTINITIDITDLHKSLSNSVCKPVANSICNPNKVKEEQIIQSNYDNKYFRYCCTHCHEYNYHKINCEQDEYGEE